MSRALIVIHSELDRKRAANWCAKAPEGTRVEFKAAKRSLDQNSRLWAMLSDVASQKEHHGKKYPTEIWKCLFMHALGREVQFIPALQDKTFLPLSLSSSDLSKAEMSELIDFIGAWGAEQGVIFHDQKPEPTAADYMAAG